MHRLVMYFCVRNYTSPSIDYATVAYSNNNQAQLYTHVSRAAGSNLRMVRPSSMSTVKCVIIRAQSMRQNFNLAIFSCQEVLMLLSSFKLGVTTCFSALQGT